MKNVFGCLTSCFIFPKIWEEPDVEITYLGEPGIEGSDLVVLFSCELLHFAPVSTRHTPGLAELPEEIK